MLEALKQAGGDPSAIASGKFATLVVSANKILAKSKLPGIHFERKRFQQGSRRAFLLSQGRKSFNPFTYASAC